MMNLYQNNVNTRVWRRRGKAYDAKHVSHRVEVVF